MTLRNDSTRYGSLSIGLHWLTLLLLIGVYACIELHEFFPKGSDAREALKSWHFMLGLAVLGLTLLRLLAAAGAPTPRIEPDPPLWQKRAGTAMHVALYLLLVGMPLGGWLMLSAAGKPVPFFGLDLPPLVAENRSLADIVKELHETGGNVGYFLIGMHAAAALFHHYFVGDNTLRRMLPR
jgi:cytochrome b561